MLIDNDLNNAWKDSNAFEKQLKLNLHELESKDNYPPHWEAFIQFVNSIKPKSVLDIGCGCGAYFKLCQRHFSDLEYTGLDYSENAIKTAIRHWGHDKFCVKDLFTLTKEDIVGYDLVHLGAVLDVLPNGDEALTKVLSLGVKNIIIGRIDVTYLNSYYTTYKAYEEIKTCHYYHNLNNLERMFLAFNYSKRSIGSTFLLTKNE